MRWERKIKMHMIINYLRWILRTLFLWLCVLGWDWRLPVQLFGIRGPRDTEWHLHYSQTSGSRPPGSTCHVTCFGSECQAFCIWGTCVWVGWGNQALTLCSCKRRQSKDFLKAGRILWDAYEIVCFQFLSTICLLRTRLGFQSQCA